MLKRLQPNLSKIEQDFIRPEAERLVEKLQLELTHQQRESIGLRLAEIGDPRPGIGLKKGLPDFVWLPVSGGKITLEGDIGTFTVEPFYISKYPMTWTQYRSNKGWWKGLADRQDEPGQQDRQIDNHPAENVSWYDAVAFCRWLSERLGYEIRLPTEWEWQQAATGGDSTNVYPWGPDSNSAYANTDKSSLGRTTAVRLYPQGASPVGALDMRGNAWEWCLNEYENSKLTKLSGSDSRVVRGGSWGFGLGDARTAFRLWYDPDARYGSVGFRVVCSSPIS
jgi:formylglycine-generating enzyme required for sulfatase activity